MQNFLKSTRDAKLDRVVFFIKIHGNLLRGEKDLFKRHFICESHTEYEKEGKATLGLSLSSITNNLLILSMKCSSIISVAAFGPGYPGLKSQLVHYLEFK